MKYVKNISCKSTGNLAVHHLGLHINMEVTNYACDKCRVAPVSKKYYTEYGIWRNSF